jgi:hypothetical protein
VYCRIQFEVRVGMADFGQSRQCRRRRVSFAAGVKDGDGGARALTVDFVVVGRD